MTIGQRLLMSCIDELAHNDPNRVWIEVARLNESNTTSFEAITYKRLANAVNCAAWWLGKALSKVQFAKTLAYQGPNDLRIPIICLAAAKTGKRILLPSQAARPDAQVHLIQQSECSTYVHATEFTPSFDLVSLPITVVKAPELHEWLDSQPMNPFPFSKTWEEAKDDSWILLHTSGTTGLPKIVAYSHEMMATLDKVGHLASNGEQTHFEYYRDQRVMTTAVMWHFVGVLVVLQFTAFLGSVVVVGPQEVPMSTQRLVNMVTQSRLNTLIAPPKDIERLSEDRRGWQSLNSIDNITYVGAQLNQELGDALVQSGTRVLCGLGTTEAGAYLLNFPKELPWGWFSFVPTMGATFERYAGNDDIFELIITRKPGYEQYQQIFTVFPTATEFRTKDLYIRHPEVPNGWRIVGRTDDFIKLSSSHGLYAARIEAALLKQLYTQFEGVVIGGTGRERPCVLGLPKSERLCQDNSHYELLTQLKQAVQDVNETCSPQTQVPPGLVMLMDSKRPVKLTAKGTINRQATLALYEKEIGGMYQDVE